MAFRVYDKKKRRWVNENIYLTPEGELFESYKNILGQNKLTAMSQDRYIYHKSIDLEDRNGTPIYMGDYLRAQVAEDRAVTGIVTYANELSAFIILCFDTDEYFTLGNEICEYIEVIGNVFEEFFDGSKKGKKDGQQTL